MLGGAARIDREPEAAEQRMLVGLVALLLGLGLVASPWMVGAPFMLALGDLFVRPPDQPESHRGRSAFALLSLAFGALSWLPDVEAMFARVALALAILPLLFVPPLLADPTLSVREALARSLDLTLRARPRDLLAAATFGAYLSLTPFVITQLWHVGRDVRLPIASLGAALGCLALAVGAAVPACLAVRALSRTAHERERAHEAPVTRAGAGTVLTMAACLVWSAAALPILVRARHLPIASFPTAVEPVANGLLVSFQRTDGHAFGVVMRSATHVLDLELTHPVGAPYLDADALGDPQVALVHLAGVALLLPVLVGLALLAWRRRDRLRAWLLQSHVLRVRFRAEDFTDFDGGPRLDAGSELLLTESALRVRLDAPLPVDAAVDTSGFVDWIDAALVAPRSWSPTAGYRTQPTPPPRGARLCVGGLERALVSARLGDLQRLMGLAALGLVLVPLAVALLTSAG